MLEYDGTAFRGGAPQPGLPTVEAALRQALAETFVSVENLAVAGRTDTGVHALGQVASVDVEGGAPPPPPRPPRRPARRPPTGPVSPRPRGRGRPPPPATPHSRAAIATGS